MSPIKLIITIVDRGRGDIAAKIYKTYGVFSALCARGMGTAKDEIIDYMGLSPEKDIVAGLTLSGSANEIIMRLAEELSLKKAGGGIAFCVRLSAATRGMAEKIAGEWEESKMEEKDSGYELVVSVVDSDECDVVTSAAREAGSTGGTVIRSRNISGEEKRFLGITLREESDIVIMLVKRENKRAIMESISSKARTVLGKNATVFSLPVSDVYGLRHE